MCYNTLSEDAMSIMKWRYGWCWRIPFSLKSGFQQPAQIDFLSLAATLFIMYYVYGYANCLNTVTRVVLAAWITSKDMDIFIYTNNAKIGLTRDFMFKSGTYLIQKTQRAS
jgi:hypothetical protein